MGTYGLAALRCGAEVASGSVVDPGSLPASAEVLLPYFCFLVDTGSARVLVDCGPHPDLPARVSPETARSLRLGGGGTLSAGLSALGVSPASIDAVVLTHLHYDHCGGLALLPRAEVYVSRAELAFATDSSAPQREAYVRQDFADLAPQLLHLLDGEHDLLGDGSIVVLPAPGHTPGHQAVLVTSGRVRVLFAGDASYRLEALRAARPSGYLWDVGTALETLAHLRQRARDAAAALVLSHDLPVEFARAGWLAEPRAPERGASTDPR